MPRKYNLQQLDAAVLSVQEGTYTLSEASRAFGVPVTTIGDHVSGRLKGTPKKNTIMTPDEEEALVAYAMLMADWGFPLTRDLMGHFAKGIMKERDPTVEFFASDGWWWRLRQRHPELSLRKPGFINRGRAAMSQSSIAESHFDSLKETLALHNIAGPSEICNVDETYFQSKASVKVVAKKGKQFPYEREVTNANHVMVVKCGSAAGQLLPPMIIFEGCPPVPEATQQGQEDAIYGSSESGHMDSKSARRRALTPVKVAASFKMTGVYPFNPHAIKAGKFIENNRAPKKTKTSGDVCSLILECNSDDEERKDQTTQTYYDDIGQSTDKTHSMTQTDTTDTTPVCYCGHICKVEQHPTVEMGIVSPAITKVLIVPAEGAPIRFTTD